MTSDMTAIASLPHPQSHIDSGRHKNYGVLITVWPQKSKTVFYICLSDTYFTNTYTEGRSKDVKEEIPYRTRFQGKYKDMG